MIEAVSPKVFAACVIVSMILNTIFIPELPFLDTLFLDTLFIDSECIEAKIVLTMAGFYTNLRLTFYSTPQCEFMLP